MAVHVRKWYFDLVTPRGEAWVGYAARVRVHGLPVGYAGWIRGGGGIRGIAHRVRMRATAPTAGPERLRWAPVGLDVDGVWAAGGSAPARRLGDGDPRLEWEVLATAADARVTLGDTTLVGSGYVECLELAGGLDLGIDVLHWGRWIADDAAAPRSIVWIEWVGPRPLRLVLVDGEAQRLEHADERCVDGTFGTLVFDGSEELRSGGLGSTVLDHLPPVVRRLARRIRGWDETKWVSRGVLTDRSGSQRKGWAIHELVRFGGAA